MKKKKILLPEREREREREQNKKMKRKKTVAEVVCEKKLMRKVVDMFPLFRLHLFFGRRGLENVVIA